MKIDGSLPIARLAAELPGAIAVFESLGLDYACAGDRSLDDAAHAEGIAPEAVIASLRRLRTTGQATAWNDRPLVDLVRHLTDQHHQFLRDELAATALRLSDSCSSLAAPPADLVSLRSAFARLSEIVLPHIHREEENLFPAVVALERAWQLNERAAPAGRDLPSQLQDLAREHAALAAHLRTMRDLRLRLQQSDDLPPQSSAVLDAVERLEAHLHEYIFLENRIFSPRALALDAQLNASAVSGRS
jgi:regulator of cell morphogenesis and NO signaling